MTVRAASQPDVAWQHAVVHGRVAIADLATSADAVYAATVHGVWRLECSSARWHSLGEPLGSVLSVAVIDSANHGETVVAGTMLGVYRLTGHTWQRLTAIDQVIGLVAVDAPTGDPSATIVAASASDGVFRSVDGGASWQSASRGLADPRGVQLVASAGHLVLGTESGICLSVDSAATWTPVGPVGAIGLLIEAADDVIVAFMADGAIWHSCDSGRTWASLPEPPAALAHLPADGECLVGIPDTDGRVLAGTRQRGVIRCGSSGIETVGGEPPLGLAARLFADSHTNTVYLASIEAGLHVSQDLGATWDVVTTPEPTVTGVLALDETTLAVCGLSGVHIRSLDRWHRVVAEATLAMAQFDGRLVATDARGGVAIDANGTGSTWRRFDGPAGAVNQVVAWSDMLTVVSSTRESNEWLHTIWVGSPEVAWTPLASARTDGPLRLVGDNERLVLGAGNSLVSILPEGASTIGTTPVPHASGAVTAVATVDRLVVVARGSELVASIDGDSWVPVDSPGHIVVDLVVVGGTLIALSPEGIISRIRLDELDIDNLLEDSYD